MTKLTTLVLLLSLMFMAACGSQEEKVETAKPEEAKAAEQITEQSPMEMLKEAYQLFKEGQDEASVELANKVLKIGKETNDTKLIGSALTSLCRNAQRDLDTVSLADLSAQLADLAETTGNQKWLMYRAHQNAEMWRLIGNMDRAEGFYNESMRISFETGSMGMYTIDHFNKSFVSIAKGDFETANQLIKKYYQLRKEANPESEDAYGLIALSYLLEQQKNYEGACEVACATRRLFEQQRLFPEPPDEKPLLMVEAKVKEMLSETTLEEITKNSASVSVSELLEKYLN